MIMRLIIFTLSLANLRHVPARLSSTFPDLTLYIPVGGSEEPSVKVLPELSIGRRYGGD